MISKPWEDYVKAVKTGRRNAGKLERLAVEHVTSLASRFDFDEAEVERIMNITHLCRHTKGKWKGVPFNLLPHQAFFLAYLFGLKADTGFRLIREAMINMSKKGGKSELDGLVAFIMTFFDGEQTAEGYIVANKTEQAMFCWKSAKAIATQFAADTPAFGEDFKFYDNQQNHVLIQPSSENFFKTLPYESSTLDGVLPHIAIIDEFHEYPDTSVPDNLVSGMILREQPLLLYSTTRGFHPYGPLAEKEEYYTNVLTGLVDDPYIFPLIFSLDDDNNWTNKNYWIQFAPGVEDGLPSYEALEGAMQKAIDEGGHTMVSNKTKNFNIWQRSKSVFVQQEMWDKGAAPIDLTKLAGKKCFAAFDLGQSDDLTAVGFLFPPDEDSGNFRFILKCFMPELLVVQRSREQKVSYQQWINEGFVIPTSGNLTDTVELADVIFEDFEKYQVEKFYGDKAFALELMNILLARGLPIESFPQTPAYMNGPIIKLQNLVNSGKLQHGGNKVLTWMMSNVTLKKNSGGQVMMDKSDRITGHGKDHKKGKKKIDGAVVLAMCVAGYINSLEDVSSSKYNDEDILIV